MTERKEVMKNPMDLVPNDPIVILQGLSSTEFPRNWSMKFSDLLRDPGTYKGDEIVNRSEDTLKQLDKLMSNPEKGYLYLSMIDVLVGLAEIKSDSAWEAIKGWIKKPDEIKNDQDMQISRRAESLLNKRATGQSATPPKA
jgi:hypothetical protein